MRFSEARQLRLWRTGTAVAAVWAVLLRGSPALAYCRTTTCDLDHQDPSCTWDGNGCATSGVPLFWSPACVGYSVQENGSPKWNITDQQADALWTDAFHTWENANCGSGHPSFEAYDTGPIVCDEATFNKKGANANILLFRDTSWPYPNGSSTLAQTTVTANLNTGEILDADIEVNSAQVELTTSDTVVRNDLQSILTHETGHFLGLAHSAVPGSTMSRLYSPDSIEFRSISSDDEAAICAVYAPGANASCTGPVIANGFSTECDSAPTAQNISDLQTSGGTGCTCSMATTTGTFPHHSAAWAGLLFVATGLGFKRSERRSRRERT